MNTYSFLSKKEIESIKKAKEQEEFNRNVLNFAAHVQSCLTEGKSLLIPLYYEQFLTENLIKWLKEAKWEIVEKKEIMGKKFIYDEMYYPPITSSLRYPKNEEKYILIKFETCEE